MNISFGFGGDECINGGYVTSVDLYFCTVLEFVQQG